MLALTLVLAIVAPPDAATLGAGAPPATTSAPPAVTAPAPASPSTPPAAGSASLATPPAATPPSAATPPAATPAPNVAAPTAAPPVAEAPAGAAGAVPVPDAGTPTVASPTAPPATASPIQATPNLRDPFLPVEPPAVSRRVTVVHHYQAPPPEPPPLPGAEEKKDEGIFFGGYGGLVLRGGALSRKPALFTGVKGGLLIGKRLSIGGAYYRVARRFGKPIVDTSGNALALKMAYGGATVGVTLIRRGPIELNVASLFGAGVGCISRDFDYGGDRHRCIETVKMFVAEPEVALYLNATSWMRLGIAGGYRFVVRENWRPPNNFIMSGGYGGVNLEFGWFGRERDT